MGFFRCIVACSMSRSIELQHVIFSNAVKCITRCHSKVPSGEGTIEFRQYSRLSLKLNFKPWPSSLNSQRPILQLLFDHKLRSLDFIGKVAIVQCVVIYNVVQRLSKLSTKLFNKALVASSWILFQSQTIMFTKELKFIVSDSYNSCRLRYRISRINDSTLQL